MSRTPFYIFPLSSVVALAALLYPRESAVTNILLSAPLSVFYLWFTLGLLVALLRTGSLVSRLGWILLIGAPIAILVQRLPAPL